jgi:hypothetical protein
MESIHAFATLGALPAWHMAVKPQFSPSRRPLVLNCEAKLQTAISFGVKIQAPVLRDPVSLWSCNSPWLVMLLVALYKQTPQGKTTEAANNPKLF